MSRDLVPLNRHRLASPVGKEGRTHMGIRRIRNAAYKSDVLHRKTIAWTIAILASVAGVTVAQSFDISRWTIDGGGGQSSDGDLALWGTIGQVDAGPDGVKTTGDSFELTGGIWIQIPLGDCEDDGDVDLHDHDRFAACISGPTLATSEECRCFDVDRNLKTDLHDFAIIQTTHTGS